MKNNRLTLVFLFFFIGLHAYSQIPEVLQDSDFATRTGAIKDPRDGKHYFYKKYGTKDWFMQNLNWDGGDGVSWEGYADPDGKKYGRFYKMDKQSLLCPEGWHSATNVEWKDLTNAVAAEYNLTEAEVGATNMLKAPGEYDMRNFMVYMRGGGMAADGGLWAGGTGGYNKEVSDRIQFNLLPSGHFTGSDYQSGHGVGVRTYVLGSLNGSNCDRYRNYESGVEMGGGSNNRSTLKHDRKTNNNYFGVVRCVRDAQSMRDQVIITSEIEPKVVSDAPFMLPAKVTSGLPLSYVSSDPNVATVDANGEVTIKKEGKITITISQTGNDEYNPAGDEVLKLAVYTSKYYVTLPTVDGVLLSPSSGKLMIVGDAHFQFSVTVVSGYEGIPVVKLSNGRTLVPTSVSRQKYNYELTRNETDVDITITGITKTPVVGYPAFATISDLQAGDAGWEERTRKALEYLTLQTPKLDAIFITGDITSKGTIVQLNSVKKLINTTVPSETSVYYSMGNDDWIDAPASSSERFTETMNQDLNKFIVIRGYPIISLSATSKEKDNSYSIETQEFLKSNLEYAKKEYPGKPIFIIHHIPNTGTVYGSGTNLWGTSNIISILEAYPEVISISGNSHFFLANELSIHQNKFTSINTGSIAPSRMETGLDDGIQPPGAENIIEGCIFTADDLNTISVKRIDFNNNKEIKQAWKIEAPHDGTLFTYKGRTGGDAPYFDAESKIAIRNLTAITFTVDVPAAKDDDDVTQYLIEILDADQKPLLRPIFKFTSDYYLATSGTVVDTISRNVTRLVENTDYYIRVTAFDAFGNKSTPLLSDKITTLAKDPANLSSFDIIANRIRGDHIRRKSASAIGAIVDNLLTLFNDADGSFTDIDYKGTSAKVWSSSTGPASHLTRLKDMVMAYVIQESTYYGSDELYKKIVKGYEYWQTKNPTSVNWWHGSIGNPQKIGVALLVMREGKKKLPVDLEAKILDRMEKQPSRQAEDAVNEGANRSDMALHYLYRACLIGDAELMNRGFVNGYEPIKLADNGKEGIQVDDSYLMHGQQLQIASYGWVFMNTSVAFGLYGEGTEFALPSDKVKILSDFARNAFFKVIRGKYVHHTSMGRSISRTNSISASGNARFADALIKLDPEHKAEYEDIIKRLRGIEPASYGVKANNTSFFVGDYVVHTRPDFSFSVRTVSNRTVRSEHGNGEALQSYFASDGFTSLMQKGDEYYNVPVGWNWTRLPGVTAPQYPFNEIPQWRANEYKKGFSNFVGGVSDSIYSANVYFLTDYHKDDSSNPKTQDPVNTQGYKSWFFFDNEVVCLGAGLTSTNVHPLNTTVEQNLLKSDVVVSTTSGEETIAQAFRGEKTYEDNLKWVLHNGAGYFFPKGGKIHTENGTVTRAWYDINNGYSKDPVSTDVFTLWFDHGLNPTNASYEYIVVPNKNTATDMNSYDISNIEILSNTSEIQAVKDKKANILQIIFTKAGKFAHDGMTIEVDEGVAIILKNIGKPEVTMHIADPGQNRMPITVQTLIPSVSEKRKETICDFSGTGRYAGKTKSFTITAASQDAQEPEVEKIPDFEYKSVVLADTYVTDVGGEKDKNYGASADLQIKLNDVAGYHRQTYTKFSISDLDKYTDKKGYDAKIFVEFYVISANTDIKTTNWVLTPVENNTWDESAITWNSKPAISGEPIAALKSFAPNTAGELSDVKNRAKFDITNYALAEYAKGNKEISLNINNNVAGPKVNSSFASKEHADTLLHPIIAVRLYKKEGVLKTQTIIFEALPVKKVGDADFTIGATSTSGLAITYTSSNEAVATIVDDSNIRIIGAGETTITASQGGNEEFEAATPVSQKLVVTQPIVEEPNIKSVTIDGYELTNLTETYVVPQAESEKTMVQITVNLEGNNQIVGNNPIVVNVRKASVQDVLFLVRNGDKTKEYTLKIEKRFNFDDIVKTKWGHIYIVNNNNANNGGYKFTHYKWFENDKTAVVSTKQYYRKQESGKSTLKVELTTENGNMLQTWPGEIDATPLKLAVYPSYVNPGQIVYLDAKDMPSEFFNSAYLKVYNVNGMPLKSLKAIENGVTPIEMPTASGIYIIRVVSGMIEETFKVIVK